MADLIHAPGRPARLILAFAVVGLASCSETPDRVPLPGWVEDQATLEDDIDDTDEPEALGTFTLVAPPKEELGWDVKLHAKGDFEEPCSVEVPDHFSDKVELDCVLEISELSLFGGGLDFDLSIAPDQCSFLIWRHPMYQAWPIGAGPPEVTVYRHPDTGLIVQELNAQNGIPYCEYDHSWNNAFGPNCCVGQYVYSVLNSQDASDYLIEPQIREWDGVLSECFGGASFLDPEAVFDVNGFPMGKIIHIEQSGFQKAFTWGNISSRGYRSNVPLASYYDPANHNGNLPAGFAHPWSLDTHTFECSDEAHEVLATIRLSVREWNTVEEFEKGAEGDPDVMGPEPGGGQLDDYADWGVATPGDSMLIMAAE